MRITLEIDGHPYHYDIDKCLPYDVARALIDVLRDVHGDVCSLNCPSVWKTGEPQPHSDKCKATSAALARAEAEFV